MVKRSKRKNSDPMVAFKPLRKEPLGWMNQFRRHCSSYLLLVVVCLAICCLQLYVGVTFFSLYSNSEAGQSLRSVPGEDTGQKQQHELKMSVRDLGLKFPCNITDREALSAISRAHTAQCKDEIASLVCRIHQGTVYPSSLPRSCPSKIDEKVKGSNLGCFRDNFNSRILQGYLAKLKDTNSPETCVNLCLNSGYTYAGTQYSLECFCGNTQPVSSEESEQSACNMPCPGDPSVNCGGYLAINIYHTGLLPFTPSKLGAVIPRPTDDINAGSSIAPSLGIVYLLTINGRAVRQVRRLIQRLDGEGSYFLVHVDSRQDYLYREMAALAAVKPNVRLTSRRFTTIWGGASLLTMLLASMEEALTMVDWPWHFILNLSESDYPVKSREELVAFLAANRDSNFVKSHGREPDKFIKKQGLDKTFLQCEDHMWRLGNRELPLGIQVDGGSDWICLNRDFSTYVVSSPDPLVSGLKVLFNYTLLPAESFFHTVLQNSQYCPTYINNNLHLTNWKRSVGCKCQYRAIVDWCGCSPNDFLSEDWSRLEATVPKQIFFARKFEPIVHHEIINRVDAQLLNVSAVGDCGDHYWQNIHHHLDTNPARDPHLLTLTSCLATHSLRTISSATADLAYSYTSEVTVYKYRDTLEAVLILIATQSKTRAHEAAGLVELKVKPLHLLYFTNSSSDSRLDDLDVGTEFDPKELLFRNYIKVLGPTSKISLRFQYSAGRQGEVYEFGWFNPLGRLVAVSQALINATSGVENLDPKLNGPLMPGSWTLVAVSKSVLLAKLNFLIIPDLNKTSRTEASSHQQAGLANNRLARYHSLTHLERTRVAEAVSSPSEGWVEGLVLQFYRVEAACGVADLPPCSHTTWSSQFPDTKFSISPA